MIIIKERFFYLSSKFIINLIIFNYCSPSWQILFSYFLYSIYFLIKSIILKFHFIRSLFLEGTYFHNFCKDVIRYCQLILTSTVFFSSILRILSVVFYYSTIKMLFCLQTKKSIPWFFPIYIYQFYSNFNILILKLNENFCSHFNDSCFYFKNAVIFPFNLLLLNLYIQWPNSCLIFILFYYNYYLC